MLDFIYTLSTYKHVIWGKQMYYKQIEHNTWKNTTASFTQHHRQLIHNVCRCPSSDTVITSRCLHATLGFNVQKFTIRLVQQLGSGYCESGNNLFTSGGCWIPRAILKKK